MFKKTLVAVVAATALAGLSACGSDSSNDASSDEGWTYTDGLGQKIELDAAPKKIVAQSSVAAALESLGVDGITATFGPLKLADGATDPQAEGLDPADVEDVTATGDYGSVDAEKVAAQAPDLIITSSYDAKQLWYLNDKAKADLEKIAPIAVINFQGNTVPENIEATKDLAEQLGADVESDDVAEQESAFEDATKTFTAAAEGLADQRVVAASPAQDVVYISSPKATPDLTYLTSLGLPLIEPEKVDSEGAYFQSLSWENADEYKADVVLYDARVPLTGFENQPVWATQNAAKDDAYVAWNSVLPPSYQAYATNLDAMATALEKFAG